MLLHSLEEFFSLPPDKVVALSEELRLWFVLVKHFTNEVWHSIFMLWTPSVSLLLESKECLSKASLMNVPVMLELL